MSEEANSARWLYSQNPCRLSRVPLLTLEKERKAKPLEGTSTGNAREHDCDNGQCSIVVVFEVGSAGRCVKER